MTLRRPVPNKRFEREWDALSNIEPVEVGESSLKEFTTDLFGRLDQVGVDRGQEFDVIQVIPPDENRRGGASHNDPPTSHKAAKLVEPRSGSQRYRCLVAIVQAGERGRTWDELEVELGMYSAQQRVSDLKQDGWIEVAGERLTRRGAQAEVYVSTMRAREWLARQEGDK